MLERRKTTRYDLGAIAEVTDLDSLDQMIAVTRDLSFSGCFLRTNSPFAEGTAVVVRIRFSGADFSATGRVTRHITREGMGVEFLKIRPEHKEVITAWLDPAPARPSVPADTIDSAVQPIAARGARMGSSDEAIGLLAAKTTGDVVVLRNRLTREAPKNDPAEAEAVEPETEPLTSPAIVFSATRPARSKEERFWDA